MFLKSLNLKSLLIAAASFAIAASMPLQLVRADIINDIDQLDKEKPEKEKEKKKEKDKDQPTKPKTQKSKDKDAGPIPTQPKKAELIPEPAEEMIIPPPAARPNKSGAKSKGKSKEQRQKAPVHLQSDGTTTYSKDRSTVVLDKNVVITQDDMRLESDEAKITLIPKASKGTSEGGVKSALLTGKVAISRYSDDPSERMNAKSDKALFDNQAQTVSLEGNARLWREGNLIKGDRILYEMTTGMIKVDKAQGVVQPERMNK
ncbi:MAG: lipopolysaccharide transport periplasmic protein LptA [Oligoflexus sp.]|nr:lipopolysaccharide transport periplasmic protein LptA [Oligoflexus sp.]